MKVNFNNIRKQALYRYEELVEKLNRAIIRNDDQYAVPNDVYHGQQVNLNGYVLIDSEDIREVLNDLRMLLGTIASCFEEGNEDCKDVFSEVYPEDASMPIFNDNEDD